MLRAFWLFKTINSSNFQLSLKSSSFKRSTCDKTGTYVWWLPNGEGHSTCTAVTCLITPFILASTSL